MAVKAIKVAVTDTFIDDPHALIDRIIELNRTHNSLQPLREKALSSKATTWKLDAQGLLTH